SQKRGPLPDSDGPVFGKFGRPNKVGTRNAIQSAWKHQKSVPIRVAAATLRKTAIIAAPIAKGRRKPAISFVTVATVTTGIRPRNSDLPCAYPFPNSVNPPNGIVRIQVLLTAAYFGGG